MINNKYLKLLRSIQRFDENNFIYNVIAKRIIDSIDLIKINFDQVLEIGVNDSVIYDYILNNFENSNISSVDLCKSKQRIRNSNFIELNLNNIKFEKNFYNLIFSNCFLHLTNDIEIFLSSIYESLKPNGFFIAAIPQSDNMYQIVNSMYETTKIYNL